MLVLHQTSPQGKLNVGPETNKPNLASAAELVRRGYVVLAPDYPSFGDYHYDFAAMYARGKFGSGTMKGIFNHMRAVDLLCERPEVDPERIGVIGHSLGGHNAMFVGAFDERLKVIVSSCGWTPFQRLLRRQNRRLDQRPLYAAAARRVWPGRRSRPVRFRRVGRRARAAGVFLQLADPRR